MSSIMNLCSAQNIIDDIEIHLFEVLFNSENKMSELIEINESKDTTRYWRFNKNFQLIEEIDNRPSFWPYNAGWHSSTRPSKKVYEYKYHSNGKVDTINETHKSEGETINTIHLFSYPNQNTITEFYKINLNQDLNFDFELTQLVSQSNIIENNQIVKNYIGDGYVETTKRLKYVYDQQLKEINHYFKVNSYPPSIDDKPMQETLGAKTTYQYDSSERLQRIQSVEYTEDGSQKLNRDMEFVYFGKSNTIEAIRLKYGENYTPRDFEYNVEYENNGDLKSISVNGVTSNYIIRR